MVFNLYILIISNLLVSRTPLITVLSTEGLSWVNIHYLFLESGYFSACDILSLRWEENGGLHDPVVGTFKAIWWLSLADYLFLLQV